MTRQRKLSPGYRHIEALLDERIVDAIYVEPRSSGHLTLPGEYSTASPPPRHEVRIEAVGPEGVAYTRGTLGNDECYRVTYEVQNYRDSPVFAKIRLT